MPHTDEQPAREGNADLIRGSVSSTRRSLAQASVFGCRISGEATLVKYPGSEICIDIKGLEISVDEAGQARMRVPRPESLQLRCTGDRIRLHPPAFDPLLCAVARVAEQFDIDTRDPMALLKLVGALVTKHYPDMLLPAGRVLSSNERAMSIAWVVDQERQDNEPSPDAIQRARPKLLDYRLIHESIGDETLSRLFREGQALLRQHGIAPWRRRGKGRPPRK